ncbi:hypothetical protein D3C87_894370 [compost metagenome]
MIFTKRINKYQNFNELHFHLVRLLTFSMQVSIPAGTRKTAINTLKAIRKNNDESLKYFFGGFGISDHGYPKGFFSAVTTEYICYRKSG